jgi:hypothetical protein
VLLGVMNSTTCRARGAAVRECDGERGHADFVLDAEFTVSGLTPGAMNFDAAYAVQVVVASTNIKYGGPNTNAGANAWGGFLFEAWDPQPQTANSTLAVDANGRVDVSKVAGTTQTARDLGAQLDADGVLEDGDVHAADGIPRGNLPDDGASPTNITSASGVALAANQHVIVDSGTVTTLTNLPAITAGWLTATGIAAGALNGKGDWLLSSGYTAPDNAGISTLTGRLTALRATNLDNLDAAITTRLSSAGYTVPPTVAAIRTEMDANSTGLAAIFARTDVATSSRAAAATALSNVDWTAARAAKVDNLDATTSSRLAASGYTAPDNSSIGVAAVAAAAAATDAAAIKLKTNSLVFTLPGKLDVNMLAVNGVAVAGLGTALSPWGPGV